MKSLKPLLVVVMALFAFTACSKSGDTNNSAADAAWYTKVSGTYKGTVGGNYDPIVFVFSQKDGVPVATYTIDDPNFSEKAYKGKLLKFKADKKKPFTATFRYEDDMNAGDYTITFTKDLKSLSGEYFIDGGDSGSVDAKKK